MSGPAPDAVSVWDFGIMQRKSRQEHRRHFFWFCVILAEFFGLAMVVLMAVWAATHNNSEKHEQHVHETQKLSAATLRHRDHNHNNGDPMGLSTYPTFDWHPMFMCIAIFFMGQAAIMFRLFRARSRTIKRLIHSLFHLLTVAGLVLALYAVVQHEHGEFAGSIHDFLAVSAFILFGMQLIIGFLGKCFPGCEPEIAAWYAPVHNFTGAFLLAFFGVTALTGVAQMNEDMANTSGKLIVFFAIALIFYLMMILIILLGTRNEEPIRRRPPPPSQPAVTIYDPVSTPGPNKPLTESETEALVEHQAEQPSYGSM